MNFNFFGFNQIKPFTPQRLFGCDTQAGLKMILTPHKQLQLFDKLVYDYTPKKKLNFLEPVSSEQHQEDILSYSENSYSEQDSIENKESLSQEFSEDNQNTVKKTTQAIRDERKFSIETLPILITAIHKCNCSKSRCLKKYCDCYRLGLICGIECQCTDCGNKNLTIEHIAANKKKQEEETRCKCSKSHCMKNYCQCHSAGKKCGSQCNCLGCQNIQSEQQKQQYKRSTPSKKIKIQEKFQQGSTAWKQ